MQPLHHCPRQIQSRALCFAGTHVSTTKTGTNRGRDNTPEAIGISSTKTTIRTTTQMAVDRAHSHRHHCQHVADRLPASHWHTHKIFFRATIKWQLLWLHVTMIGYFWLIPVDENKSRKGHWVGITVQSLVCLKCLRQTLDKTVSLRAWDPEVDL